MSKAPKLSVALIGMPGEHDGEEHTDGASRDDAKDAMEAFIEAIHAKDTEGALQAYEALCDMHSAAEDEDDEEEGRADESRDGY